MNAPSDKPLQKVTMNFFREDVAELVAKYGTGWTTQVREIIHKHLKDAKLMQTLIDEEARYGQ